MLDKLKEINKHSYSPYSNFSVSAIVVMKDGKEFPVGYILVCKRGYIQEDFQVQRGLRRADRD